MKELAPWLHNCPRCSKVTQKREACKYCELLIDTYWIRFPVGRYNVYIRQENYTNIYDRQTSRLLARLPFKVRLDIDMETLAKYMALI